MNKALRLPAIAIGVVVLTVLGLVALSGRDTHRALPALWGLNAACTAEGWVLTNPEVEIANTTIGDIPAVDANGHPGTVTVPVGTDSVSASWPSDRTPRTYTRPQGCATGTTTTVKSSTTTAGSTTTTTTVRETSTTAGTTTTTTVVTTTTCGEGTTTTAVTTTSAATTTTVAAPTTVAGTTTTIPGTTTTVFHPATTTTTVPATTPTPTEAPTTTAAPPDLALSVTC